jgi:uracil phosphoribosyltransferase
MNTKHLARNYLLQGILRTLRDKRTGEAEFRRNLRLAGYWMTAVVLGEESEFINKGDVETPLGRKGYSEIADKVVQVMIMRAGQPLCEGGTRLLEEACIDHKIGIVDAKRIELGNGGFEYRLNSVKVPSIDEHTLLLVYDPMLATGGTLISAISELNKIGSPNMTVSMHIVCARYGLDQLRRNHPHVLAYTIGYNDDGGTGLDRNGFISGDLGDCGDRAFGRYI